MLESENGAVVYEGELSAERATNLYRRLEPTIPNGTFGIRRRIFRTVILTCMRGQSSMYGRIKP